MCFPGGGAGPAVEADHPYLRAPNGARCIGKAFAVGRKPAAILTGLPARDLFRVTSSSRNKPEMRLPRVFGKIYVDCREHHPASIWRHLRIANPLERHHVLERKWMFLSCCARILRGRLRNREAGQDQQWGEFAEHWVSPRANRTV